MILDVPATYTWDIPEAILQAKPYLVPLVNTLYDSMLIYQTQSRLHHFDGSSGEKDWQIVLANPHNENPHGEWNTLEVLCYQNHAIHIINDRINMVILNAYYQENGQQIPLTWGRLVLQSEGAVIYFKDIEYKSLKNRPQQLAPYLTG